MRKHGAIHNLNNLEVIKMSNENTTLSPAEIELISNVSGVYSAPFWDGLREVSGPLDTVRK